MKTLPRFFALTLTALLFATAQELSASDQLSPVEVVQAFLAADAKGEALDGNVQNVLRYTTWPDAPGWDTVTVTKSATCRAGKESRSKATVVVTYENVGALAQTIFTALPDQETVTYTLVQQGDQWKIDEPQWQPHITPTKAIALLKAVGNAEAKASIAELKKL